MTDSHEHPTFEQLSDDLDQRLAPADREMIERHLLGCSACAARRATLHALHASASALPMDTEPLPPHLWRDIHARISQPVPLGSRSSARFWRLAAAAVVLVALSSGITLLVTRRITTVVVALPPSATPGTSAALTGPARAIDADYASALRELNETLEQKRPGLDPATVAKVEASLRIIDLAITEARRALAGDPANRTLIDLLAASYERKVELLRRANELPPST